MRWHVRAFCEKNGDYRDFVLSRFRGELEPLGKSDWTREMDAGWSTQVVITIEPDSRLNQSQREIIETDYGMTKGQLVIPTRGALAQYVLQRYQLDPHKIQPRASAQQIVVANLDELKPWLYE